ncbi:MAG: hypothetical protein H7276_04840 [Caulobacter sp.]|nr:hypothetical protein [Vitreoscilla sp.]
MTRLLPATRRRRLGLAVVATLAATVWAATQDDASPEDANVPSRAATTRTPPRTASTPTALAQAWPDPPAIAERPSWRDALPQGVAAWGPAPPPPVAPPPARAAAASAPPQPPEFPYTLIGRIDDGQPWAMLSNRERSFGAKASDVIDDVWRVDAIDASGVTLTWLPGGITRILAFRTS